MPPSADSLFACDVGNTRVGIALVEEGRIATVVRVPLAGLDGLADCFRLAPKSPDSALTLPVIVSSVNPLGTARLSAVVTEFTAGPFLLAGRDFPIPTENATKNPAAVGQDRLLAALAAWQATRGPTIVIDVGTATTVDAVDAVGRFLGGAILPGPALGAWALHQKTAALPEVALGGPVEAVGRDTESAIRAGLVLGAAGAIERLVAEQRKILGGVARVIGTGGGLSLLRASLACLDEVRPDLVLEGLAAAYLAQR